MDIDELGERVASVETRVVRIENDIDRMRAQLCSTATKDDVKQLQVWIEKRDLSFSLRLWYLVFALVGIVSIIAGVREASRLFMG